MAENELKSDDPLMGIKPRNKEEDLLRLAKASQFSGVATAVGVLLVVGAIGYSMWQLNDLGGQVKDKEKELENVQSEISNKKRDHDELSGKLERVGKELEKKQELLAATEKQLDLSRDNRRSLKAGLENMHRDPNWINRPGNESQLVKFAVQPVAEANPLGSHDSKDRPLYEFVLRLDFLGEPELRTKTRALIQQVSYEFNYPGFPDRAMTAGPQTAADGFPVKYRGWGAVQNVIITIQLKNGAKVPLDFDMTKSLPHVNPKLPVPTYRGS